MAWGLICRWSMAQSGIVVVGSDVERRRSAIRLRTRTWRVRGDDESLRHLRTVASSHRYRGFSNLAIRSVERRNVDVRIGSVWSGTHCTRGKSLASVLLDGAIRV